MQRSSSPVDTPLAAWQEPLGTRRRYTYIKSISSDHGYRDGSKDTSTYVVAGTTENLSTIRRFYRTY